MTETSDPPVPPAGLPSQGLTREGILNGQIASMVSEQLRNSNIKVWTEAQLHASQAATLEGHTGDVWLFGYGSLIWNPACHVAERRTATLYSYHRRFCLWSTVGRGTPSAPGLVLGLERGGSCRGVILRIEAKHAWDELAIVWRREMVTGAYQPRFCQVQTEQGRVTALAFVMNHRYPRYAGRLSEVEVAQVLRTRGGPLGSCREYLEQTVAGLDHLGIHDARLHRVLGLVRAGDAA